MAKKKFKTSDWGHIKNVFLDLDGTLLDLFFDNYFWHQFLPREYSKKFNISYREAYKQLQIKYKKKIGTIDWYCVDYWSKELGLDIASLKNGQKHRITVFPFVRKFLSRLRKKNYKIFLITNAHPDVIRIKLKKTWLEHEFDHIISSHSFGAPKETSVFWKKLSEQITYDPDETLFIDDSPGVLDKAHENKIKYILTTKQPDSSKPIRTKSDYPMISNFIEILPE